MKDLLRVIVILIINIKCMCAVSHNRYYEPNHYVTVRKHGYLPVSEEISRIPLRIHPCINLKILKINLSYPFLAKNVIYDKLSKIVFIRHNGLLGNTPYEILAKGIVDLSCLVYGPGVSHNRLTNNIALNRYSFHRNVSPSQHHLVPLAVGMAVYLDVANEEKLKSYERMNAFDGISPDYVNLNSNSDISTVYGGLDTQAETLEPFNVENKDVALLYSNQVAGQTQDDASCQCDVNSNQGNNDDHFKLIIPLPNDATINTNRHHISWSNDTDNIEWIDYDSSDSKNNVNNEEQIIYKWPYIFNPKSLETVNYINSDNNQNILTIENNSKTERDHRMETDNQIIYYNNNQPSNNIPYPYYEFPPTTPVDDGSAGGDPLNPNIVIYHSVPDGFDPNSQFHPNSVITENVNKQTHNKYYSHEESDETLTKKTVNNNNNIVQINKKYNHTETNEHEHSYNSKTERDHRVENDNQIYYNQNQPSNNIPYPYYEFPPTTPVDDGSAGGDPLNPNIVIYHSVPDGFDPNSQFHPNSMITENINKQTHNNYYSHEESDETLTKKTVNNNNNIVQINKKYNHTETNEHEHSYNSKTERDHRVENDNQIYYNNNQPSNNIPYPYYEFPPTTPVDDGSAGGDPLNPNIVNPNIVNPNIVNPNIVNPNIVNPNIVNPNIVNPNIVNPNIVISHFVPDGIDPNSQFHPNSVITENINKQTHNNYYSHEESDETLTKKTVNNNNNIVQINKKYNHTETNEHEHSYNSKTERDHRVENDNQIYYNNNQPSNNIPYPYYEFPPTTPVDDGSAGGDPLNPNIVNPNIVNPNIVNPNIVISHFVPDGIDPSSQFHPNSVITENINKQTHNNYYSHEESDETLTKKIVNNNNNIVQINKKYNHTETNEHEHSYNSKTERDHRVENDNQIYYNNNQPSNNIPYPYYEFPPTPPVDDGSAGGDPLNPNIVNPNIVNPNIVNPNIVNPNIVNPNIVISHFVPDGIDPNSQFHPNSVIIENINKQTHNNYYSHEESDETLTKKTVNNNNNIVQINKKYNHTETNEHEHSYKSKTERDHRVETDNQIYYNNNQPSNNIPYPYYEFPPTTPVDDGSAGGDPLNPNIVNPNIVNPNIVNPNIVNPNIVISHFVPDGIDPNSQFHPNSVITENINKQTHNNYYSHEESDETLTKKTVNNNNNIVQINKKYNHTETNEHEHSYNSKTERDHRVENDNQIYYNNNQPSNNIPYPYYEFPPTTPVDDGSAGGDPLNPNIVNPNIVNPNIVNPNIVNPNIVNPNIVNPNIVNPNIVNPNIVNPNIVNPNIVNPNIVISHFVPDGIDPNSQFHPNSVITENINKQTHNNYYSHEESDETLTKKTVNNNNNIVQINKKYNHTETNEHEHSYNSKTERDHRVENDNQIYYNNNQPSNNIPYPYYEFPPTTPVDDGSAGGDPLNPNIVISHFVPDGIDPNSQFHPNSVITENINKQTHNNYYSHEESDEILNKKNKNDNVHMINNNNNIIQINKKHSHTKTNESSKNTKKQENGTSYQLDYDYEQTNDELANNYSHDIKSIDWNSNSNQYSSNFTSTNESQYKNLDDQNNINTAYNKKKQTDSKKKNLLGFESYYLYDEEVTNSNEQTSNDVDFDLEDVIVVPISVPYTNIKQSIHNNNVKQSSSNEEGNIMNNNNQQLMYPSPPALNNLNNYSYSGNLYSNNGVYYDDSENSQNILTYDDVTYSKSEGGAMNEQQSVSMTDANASSSSPSIYYEVKIIPHVVDPDNQDSTLINSEPPLISMPFSQVLSNIPDSSMIQLNTPSDTQLDLNGNMNWLVSNGER